MWYKFRRHMQHLPDNRTARELIRAMFDIVNTQCLSSAGLASNVAAVQAGNAFAIVVAGYLYTFPAVTAMAALTGSVIPNTGNIATIYAFTCNKAGALGVIQGSTAPTVGGCTFPIIPDDTGVIGFLFLSNGSAGSFTPGTTSLATAGVTAQYANLCGPEYPVTLLGS